MDSGIVISDKSNAQPNTMEGFCNECPPDESMSRESTHECRNYGIVGVHRMSLCGVIRIQHPEAVEAFASKNNSVPKDGRQPDKLKHRNAGDGGREQLEPTLTSAGTFICPCLAAASISRRPFSGWL